MFTLEESAHLRRMIRAIWVGLFLLLGAVVYFLLER